MVFERFKIDGLVDSKDNCKSIISFYHSDIVIILFLRK